ncbi:MAG: insulinase family protein, partial [Planctomycetaceae bacterium]|nr:insulinase family protein [Planctomycetaceae bacterium]
QFPYVMSGVAQSLLAEEDEPQRKALTELRKCCYDSPWGRSTEGTLGELESITFEDVIEHAKRHLRPNGALIGVAGNVDAEAIRDCVEKQFADWDSLPEPTVDRQATAQRSHHLTHESAQTHIALAFNAVPYGHPDYYTAWAAVNILSGGSSSRLFTEVREKRGLCYSVYATLNSLLLEGRVMAYAGTTTERAQETLDVMIQEIQKLKDGIAADELARCHARAKSALIMQQESTGARASSIARDWFHLQRINTLEDVRKAVEAVTVDQILDYVERYPAEHFTILTIGEKPLKLPTD